ncbi:MAG TPA: UDP-3-O-(3-hydroxymyristoyl)glucosamine N-acyltransferase [Acidobacteriota bacterium]|nr:UDP-3-O-(3-hydroxymyristoyl)glucosamine N-acyltransferase [Acidobacteriota bacterium]HQM64095.1 UDP-3-O-(3-hydroxymyristoyl)glucosamine N-acyltransferase [Acidobacteriota bacterium]
MKLKDIAARVNCRYSGDGETEIRAVRSVERAGPGEITFVMDRKHQKIMAGSKASAFIVAEDFPAVEAPTIRSRFPNHTFALVQELFYLQPLPKGPLVHPSAVVAPDAVVGPDCYIGPHVVIESGCRLGRNVRILANTTLYPGVSVGDDTLIHSNCVVREYCQLGCRVILQNGVVIGADGFGFAQTADGGYHKIPQAGRVIVEDDVEIQAHTCVDRGTLDDTRIGRGTKLDNLIQVGHGSTIGENCVFAGQVGLAGTTTVGNNVKVGGQVGMAGHCIVGDNAVIEAGSAVITDVEKGAVVIGVPATDHKLYKRCTLAFFKLPELMNRVRELEKEIERMKHGHE